MLPAEDEEDDLDFDIVPGSTPLLESAMFRRTAIGGGLFVGLLLVALIAWPSKKPSKATSAPVSVGSALPPEEKVGTSRQLELPDETELGPELEAPADGDEKASPADEENGRALRRRARQLLEAGHVEEGVAAARRAIEANPNDSENYILLAAGLQDLGRWQESRDIFAKCVHRSNGSASAECRYFATHGRK
jgi:hypothetical protein